MSTTFEDAALFKDTVTFLSNPVLPDGCIDADNIEAGAGIEASKLQHLHVASYAQESGTTAAAEARVVHVAKADGTILGFNSGCVVANESGATVTVDLLVNGASVLTAAVEIDDADAAYALVAGVVDTAAYEADDVIEVSVTVAAGGGTLGKGVFAAVDLAEAYV